MDGLLCVGITVALLIGGFHQLWLWSVRTTEEAKQRRLRQQARGEEIRLLCERRALELIAEFPAASDDEVAVLMRDELQNERISDGRFFGWSTPETVGRLRRTVIVTAIRAAKFGD